jgi:hypothetical protein
MNKAQIAEMKATIKTEYEAKIGKLREEMEDALSSLSRVEKTLIEESVLKNSNIEAASLPLAKPILKKRWHISKSATERIMTALQEMDAEFSSGQLKEKANNDGYGKEIIRGTFGGIFADLIKTGKIIVVQERKGNQGGLYIRGDQGKTQSESSPDMR